MRKSYLILTIIFSFIICSCNNDSAGYDSVLSFNLSFQPLTSGSRAIPAEYGNITLIEAWVTDVNEDVVTSGINKDTPAGSAISGESVDVIVKTNEISQFVLKVEFDTERIFMGFIQVFISEHTQSVDITLYETPTSSNINTFRELDDYIQNNF